MGEANMWQLIVFAILIIALAIWVFRIAKTKKTPHDTYVCDICGEKDCVCHKQEKG